MTRYLIILIVASLTVCCSSKGNANKEEEVFKQNFSAERNIIDTMRLKRTNFKKQLVSNGKLKASQKSDLRFGENGKIVKIAVKNGSWVEKGTLIAKLDTHKSELELKDSEASIKKANLEISDYLIGQGYGAAADDIPENIINTAHIKSGYNAAILQQEKAKAQIAASEIIAPFSGRIASLELRENEYSAEKFCTLIDDRAFDVDFSILETELPFVKIGSEVKVGTFASDAKFSTGRVTEINPLVESNGQVKIKAVVSGNNSFLEGMNVKVYVENSIPASLVVPKNAVVIRDNFDVLFKYDTKTQKSIWTYVNVIYANSTSYVVTANTDRNATLVEGDIIIIEGNLNLADGSNVEVKAM